MRWFIGIKRRKNFYFSPQLFFSIFDLIVRIIVLSQMKSIFLVSIVLLSSWHTESKEVDLCRKDGPHVVKYTLAFKQCLLTHLKDTGEEGKTKKCAKDFTYKGSPGHEADKEHCKANTHIVHTAIKCLVENFDGMKDNGHVHECIMKTLPDGDYGLVSELLKSFAKKVTPSI